MASVIEPDDIDFSLYLEETEAQQKVKPASVYVEDMLHWMFTPNLEQVTLSAMAKSRGSIPVQARRSYAMGGYQRSWEIPSNWAGCAFAYGARPASLRRFV